jgi:hypothetical protein
MTDIFLSYASEDVEYAGKLAHALSRHGWSVWWDRSILPGKIFDAVIEAELSAAKCVIVLWTQHSVESRWVRAEAGEALDKGRLIPVLLDEVVIPLVFRQVQAASLIGWDGDDAHAGFQHLLKAIGAVAPPQLAAATSTPGSPVVHTAVSRGDANVRTDTDASGGGTRPERRLGWWALAAVCVLAIAGGAAYFMRDGRMFHDVSERQTGLSPGLIMADSAPRTEPSKADAASGEQAVAAAKPAQTTPAPPEPDPDPEPPKRASPAVEPAKPVAVKPVIDKPAVPAPQIVVKPAPAPPPDAPAAPLSILAVAWAMPNDHGTASAARVKEYSTQLSRMMTAVVDEVIGRPVRFEYHYPSQQEYYRLLKDKDGYAASKALCSANRADLVITGFVTGAKFVSSSYGYALTRDPVFSVFDCKANHKIVQTYQVAEHVDDGFPYEKATTNVFRSFVQQEAALADR